MPGGMGGSFSGSGPGPGFRGGWAARHAYAPPLTILNVTANAGLATGSGQAFDASVSVSANAGLATGTGAAFGASETVLANAGLATGTGQAFDATTSAVLSNPPAAALPGQYSEGSGFEPAPAPGFRGGWAARVGFSTPFTVTDVVTNANAGLATGSGQAFDATVEVDSSNLIHLPGRWNIGPAPGFGSISQLPWTKPFSNFAAISANAGLATGSGQAFNITASVAPTAGLATGTGQAFNATASTGDVQANAAPATGSGQAFNASVSVSVTATAATGTGQAFDASAEVAPTPAPASGIGTAFDATVADPVVNAGLATGSGQAFDATVSALFSASPQPAGGGLRQYRDFVEAPGRRPPFDEPDERDREIEQLRRNIAALTALLEDA